MANELQISAPTGLTLYLMLLTPAGQWYNQQSQAYEAYNAANWQYYALSIVEPVAGSGVYFASLGSWLPAGLTLLPVYQQVGSSPASTDCRSLTGNPNGLTLVLDWSGTVVNSLTRLGAADDARPQQLPVVQSSPVTVQNIINALYSARLKLARSGVASITIDGETTQFLKASDLDDQILFWERKAAILSGKRRRTQSIRMDHWD